MSIKNEFVPYKEALALKELDFNEPCIAWFAETKELQIAPETYKKWTRNPCDNSNIVKVFNPDCFTAPTFSQAFKWFREKHELYHSIIPYRSTHDNYVDGTCHIEVRDSSGKDHAEYDDNEYFYEEAELACLKKLIEIVQGGNNEQQ